MEDGELTRGYVPEGKFTHEELGKVITAEARAAYYLYLHKVDRGRFEPRWRGKRVVKQPTDLILYAQAVWENKPDFIIETGTRFGGSALFFGDMLMLSGGKKVITIDTGKARPSPKRLPEHPFVEYITADSVDLNMFRKLRSRLKGKGSVMVTLDSDHHTKHVAKELEYYSQLVTPNQYLVVEDCWAYKDTPYPPHKAVEEFLAERKDFIKEDVTKQFIFGVTRDGWLRRTK